MFTSAAARVQHPPGQQATLSQLSECRLGPTDIPGRNSLHVNGIEILRLPDVNVACQCAWTFRLGHDSPSLRVVVDMPGRLAKAWHVPVPPDRRPGRPGAIAARLAGVGDSPAWPA